MKLKFMQPKYIIPLIMLPFVFIFNFMYLDFFPEKIESSDLKTKNEINTDIPEPDVESIGIDNKLDNLKNNFKNFTDMSAMMEEVKEEGGDVNSQIGESLYTEEEAREIMELRDSLKLIKEREKELVGGQYLNFKNQKDELENKKEKDSKEEFINELKLVDSILNYKEKPIKNEPKKEKTSPNKEIHTVVNKENLENTHFNTLSTKNNYTNIEALVDENIKVKAGSRVRIKLDSDIMVDSILIKKHQYVFGIVSNFSKQRVEINITNIIVDNKLYEVDLDVYDVDGMKGLYVPSSDFNDFAKDLGNNSLGEEDYSSESESSSFMVEMSKQLVGTASKSMKKLIKKNKATLKYNTRVHLINNNKN